MKYSFSYLVTIQFLGFRFHGWQKQPKIKTLHESVDKTLTFVLKGDGFKTIGVGRTDSKVSSSNYHFQLFTDKEIIEIEFLESFNRNAPSDLKTLSIEIVEDSKFNIIQSSKIKEYHYYFSNEGKNHPYAAPFMSGYKDLDIDKMIQGAKLFEGTHFFGSYCTKPSKDSLLVRTIDECKIVVNHFLRANFFPEQSYVLVVKGSGFLRYQIRLMMGALIEVGKGSMSLDEVKKSLVFTDDIKPLSTIAPGSGLHLYNVEFVK